jgi:calcineurin-like phosphoesterase family protein
MRNRIKYWIISDTHFGHEKLVKDGYRKEGFEDKIIQNCTKMIGCNDVLIHLGDVSFYKNRHWQNIFLDAICTYRTILVLGNHDRETLSWYYDRGWSFVCDSFDLKIFGFNFRFTHRPVDTFHNGFNDSIVDFNIHGHLHDRSYRDVKTSEFHHLVSVEETMAPVNLRTIAEQLQGH